MATKNQTANFDLRAESIDAVSEQIVEFLQSVKMEKRNILRLRLTVEEILLKWQDCFGEQTSFEFGRGERFGKPYVSLTLAGQECRPFDENEADEYGNNLLARLGLSPRFRYRDGKNIITITPAKSAGGNPMLPVMIALLAAVVIGALGLFVLPESVRTGAREYVTAPLFDTFLGLLSTLAPPMVFLAVISGICGIGDANILGRLGKRMLVRTFGVAVFSVLIAISITPYFVPLHLSEGGMSGAGVKDIIKLLLGILPQNCLAPFLNGNTMQVIFLAVFIGTALLVLGERVRLVSRFLLQADEVAQYLIDLANRLLPAFVFIAMLQMIWSDDLKLFIKSWKMFVLLLVISFIIVSLRMILMSLRYKVKLSVLIPKLLPAFLLTFATSSSTASFATANSVCEHQMGVDGRIAKFGMPMYMVCFRPVASVSFAICTMFFADAYNVDVSLTWFAMALVVITIGGMSVPPVSGGAAVCYTLVFLQLGIPAQALGPAMVFETLVDGFCTACDVVHRQMELVSIAEGEHLFRAEILRKPNMM